MSYVSESGSGLYYVPTTDILYSLTQPRSPRMIYGFMRYEEFRPREPLSRFIRCFWVLEGPQSHSSSPERILPDGCTEIVFHSGDPFDQHNANGSTERQPLALLVGQMRSHLLIQPTGVVRVFGIRFWPGGAYPFMRVPQSEIAGQVLPLESVWGALSSELHSRIADAPEPVESVKQVEIVLLARLSHLKHLDEGLLQMTEFIFRSGGSVAVERLAGEMGITTRKLDRLFNARVGLTPKALCRIVRFQKIFRLLEDQQSRDWAQLAVECGYYDQSHFIKEFSMFAGQVPTFYFAHQNALSEYFTTGA